MSQREFACVYDENVWRVYGFFAYWVDTRADAEDLTQQTFERALRAWARYDASRASVSTWLLVIARNLMIDHHRLHGEARQKRADISELDAVAATPDPASLGLDPELEQALAMLAPRERELIALRFGADLNGPEISRLTGLSLANVQQILSRSLRRMRDALQGSELQISATKEGARCVESA
jgi:RNA polymerase sigma-70 factor (ECF subfamily)